MYARRRIYATTPIALSHKLALSAAAQMLEGPNSRVDWHMRHPDCPWARGGEHGRRRCSARASAPEGISGLRADWIARGAGPNAAALVYTVGEGRRRVGAAGGPAECEYMHRGSECRRAVERLGRCRSLVCRWTYHGSENSSCMDPLLHRRKAMAHALPMLIGCERKMPIARFCADAGGNEGRTCIPQCIAPR